MKRFDNGFSASEYLGGSVAVVDKLKKLKGRRKRWLSVHLWLGLGLGIFLSIFGLTGSLLVFYEEIDNLINADLRQVMAHPAGENAYRSFADNAAAAMAAMPESAILNFVDYPSNVNSTYKFAFTIPTAHATEKDEWQVHVNPYSAQVTGKHLIKKADDLFPRTFIPFVFRLHFALLSGEIGGVIVGIMGILLVFSVLTGLIVWWPLTGHWHRALRIKSTASFERLNHDIHQTAGIYTFPILIVVLVSGVYMNLPDQFITVVKQLSPGTEGFMDNPKSMPIAQDAPIGLVKAFEIARQRYKDGQVDWLSNPEDENGVYVISLSEVPDMSSYWSQRLVIVDQYSGAILKVQDPSTRKTAGQTFIDWQWPLHSGRAFGWTGRLLVFLSGLACPVLFTTGIIRWLQKRKARSKKASRLV